jgi:Transcriptional regulator, AbiEi antitoxin, Type IV TA system
MNRTVQTPPASARASLKAELAHALDAAFSGATDGPIRVARVQTQSARDAGPDLSLTLDAAGKSVAVAVETLGVAYPRDIHGAVWKLTEYQRAASPAQDLILLIAAESLSPGAREQLRHRGIGYFERNGNLHLHWRNCFINIERPNLPSRKRDATFLFTGARETVVHALLVNRDQWTTGTQLAEMARTSSYTCSVVLQELERRGWCESTGTGRTLRRKLTQPKPLLEAWAIAWTNRKEERTRWHTFAERPHLLGDHLAQQIENARLSFDWAFTGAVAANVYAPLLTHIDTAEIIVPCGHAEELAREIGLKPAEKGANVCIVEREGASFLFGDASSTSLPHLSSPFICYLDLLDGRGRNKELARHVLEKLDL